jgi:hypothetical protein
VQLLDRADNTLKAFRRYSVIIMLNGIRDDQAGANIVSMRARVPMTIVTGPEVTSPNKFYECSSNTTDLKALCEAIGGEYDAIKTPPCLLMSVGVAANFYGRDKFLNNKGASLHLQSDSDKGEQLILSNKGESTYWMLGKRSNDYSPDRPNNFTFDYWDGIKWNQAIDMMSNGNVGVGNTNPQVKLDVNGAIRPGASSSVTKCGSGAANGEGSLRYNYSSHLMEFCNGSIWKVFGGNTRQVNVITNLYMNWEPSGGGNCGSDTQIGWDGTAHIRTCAHYETISFLAP